jgi:hypothetical protein
MHRTNEKCLRNLVIRSSGRIRIERSSHRWKYNTKMDLEKMVCEGTDWVGS